MYFGDISTWNIYSEESVTTLLCVQNVSFAHTDECLNDLRLHAAHTTVNTRWLVANCNILMNAYLFFTCEKLH